MTIDKFLEWLENQLPGTWDAGRLLPGEERYAIYPDRAVVNPTALGGLSSYRGHAIRVLVHWNKNILASQPKANEVYNLLKNASGAIDGKRIIKVNMRDPDPVFIGVDESGVFEFVIDCEILLER